MRDFDFDVVSQEYRLYEQCKVTPALAQLLLEECGDPAKRNLRGREMRRYARDMLAGEWHANGSAIGFSKAGMLQNGHHRLNAIIEAGKENPDIVVCLDFAVGLEDKARRSHDKGVPRKYQDDLHMEGVANAAKVASLTRHLWYWEHPSGPFYVLIGGKVTQNLKPSDQELETYRLGDEEKGLPSHEEEISFAVTWAISRYQKARLAPTDLALVYVILHRINSQAADKFLEGLVHGDGLPGDSPILVLRDKLARLDREDLDSKLINQKKLAAVFRAWNHFRAGTTTRSIVVPKPLTNQRFPYPK